MAILRKTTYLIVICFFFCTAHSSEVKQALSEYSGKLSSEVLSAMEGNQATLDSVHTMQATLTKRTSHSLMGKKAFQLVQKYKIVYDGDHFRKDQLEIQFRGEEVYRSYADALRTGQVDIESAESTIDYNPLSNTVFVRPPDWSNRYKIRTNDMLKYQSARGATLKENILASAKNGYYFSVITDTIDEEGCLLLTCNYTNPESTLKIWVVPAKGYCIKKVQDGSKGEVDDEYTTTLKEYSPGVWWFDTIQAREAHRRETIISKLSMDSLIFNEPIEPDIFTVWGLDITSQTKIWDEMQRKMYTLAIDDAEDALVKPTNSVSKILIVWLGVLMLAALAFFRTIIKGRNVRGEQ